MKNVFIFYAIIQLLLSSALSQGVECPDNYYGVDEGITLNECRDMGSGNYEKYWCQDENTVLVGFYKDAQCSPSTESWTAPYECTLEGDIHGLNAYPCKCDFNCADTQFESSWSNGGAMGTRTNTEAVVFNYNSKIFILGSWNNPKGLYECDITSSGLSCTDKGTNILNEDIRTYSQSYTQISNLGYLLGDYVTAQTSLYVYTLSNNAPTLSKTITIPKNRAGNTACLTNTNDKLFVIGGQDKANLGTKYYRSKTLQIYNLPNGPWETNPYPDDMNRERDACACVVVGDYVYAIGGYSKLYAVNYNKDIDTIERIQITNILNNKWQYTPYNLLQGINSLRAIVIDEKYIITISGLRTNIAVVSTTQAIQIINTIDNTIKYANGAFNTRSYGNAVIHINNIIYAFGGWNDNNPGRPINTWQYITLLSDSPTISPTISPTQYTYSPSISPTYKPTNSPTVSPTEQPTIDPTTFPTQMPILIETTMLPTIEFTASPTNSPLTCPYYAYDEYSSVDGADYDIDFDAMTKKTQVILGPTHGNIIGNITAIFLQTTKRCDNDDGCNFECSETAACYLASFTCNSLIGCNIFCSQGFSCGKLNVYAINSGDSNGDSNGQQIHVECYKDSCQEMEIFIDGVDSAHIHCKEEDACTDMIVHFNNITSRNNPNTSVTCYVENACTNLKIFADGELSKLHMYGHSENIILNNGYGWSVSEDTITCDLDTKFVKYVFNDASPKYYLETLMKGKQSIRSDKLPCQGINVTCLNGNTTGSCIMTYVFADQSRFDSLPGLIDTKFYGQSCVYIALYDMVRLQCQGNCKGRNSLSPTIAPLSAPTPAPSSTLTYSPSNAPNTGNRIHCKTFFGCDWIHGYWCAKDPVCLGKKGYCKNKKVCLNTYRYCTYNADCDGDDECEFRAKSYGVCVKYQ